ncbi:MAG: hypothetical protein ACLT74_07835 [Christensenellales bacterium]
MAEELKAALLKFPNARLKSAYCAALLYYGSRRRLVAYEGISGVVDISQIHPRQDAPQWK